MLALSVQSTNLHNENTRAQLWRRENQNKQYLPSLYPSLFLNISIYDTGAGGVSVKFWHRSWFCSSPVGRRAESTLTNCSLISTGVLSHMCNHIQSKQTSRTIFFYKNAENIVYVNFAWKKWRWIQSKTWVVLYSNQWKALISYYLKVNNLILQEHGLSPQDEWCYSQTYSPTPFLFFPHTAEDGFEFPRCWDCTAHIIMPGTKLGLPASTPPTARLSKLSLAFYPTNVS